MPFAAAAYPTMAAAVAKTPLYAPKPCCFLPSSTSKFRIPLLPHITYRPLFLPMISLTSFSSLQCCRCLRISGLQRDEPRKGADILVEALEREGVTVVFAYPGGASVDIHQALTRSNLIRNVMPRHEQGGIFAAEGYARSSGRPGVCIATSGPGATNLVSGLADALLDSIPVVAITGQVPQRMMGTNTFQDIPIIEVSGSITKHNYLVRNVEDIPRIVREAFYLATSGRPGPVLIDIPKDVLQQQLVFPNWNQPMKLEGYMTKLPAAKDLEEIVRLISNSKKPVLYVGGGCLESSKELTRFVELTGIPVASTLMGLGSISCSNDLSLDMVGMYGTVYANYAVDKADLLLAFGVRFDERVTGKLEAFASRAMIVHIDIDSSEIGKKKIPHLSICGDVKLALQGMNELLTKHVVVFDFAAWGEELNEQKMNHPLRFGNDDDAIIPSQYAIQVLDQLTDGNAIVTTGVGNHQMWAAQFYKYKKPRQLLTSSGFGAMGFGLPAAMGASLANPDSVVVDIDGDGSFMMNIQELATIRVENLPVKIMLLNNQHLGMVVQWEDQYANSNRADSYLGDPSRKDTIFPDMVMFAEACGITAARVTKKVELRAAIKKMLDTPGPYLLDIIVPYQHHVLPMIPSGATFNDTIFD